MLLRAIAARSVFLSALPRSHSFMVAEAVKKPLKDGSPCMGTFPTWGKNQPLKVRNCRCPYSDRHDDRTGTESMQGLLMAGADLRHTASSRTSRSRYFDKRFTEERAHQHCAFTNTAEDWLGTTGYSSFRGFPGQSSCVLKKRPPASPTGGKCWPASKPTARGFHPAQGDSRRRVKRPGFPQPNNTTHLTSMQCCQNISGNITTFVHYTTHGSGIQVPVDIG